MFHADSLLVAIDYYYSTLASGYRKVLVVEVIVAASTYIELAMYYLTAFSGFLNTHSGTEYASSHFALILILVQIMALIFS